MLRVIVLGALIFGSAKPAEISGLPGNVTVAGFFQIFEPATSGCSDEAVIASVQHVEAVKWVFKNLNRNDYIPGISIGLSIHPTCQSREVASEATFDLLHDIALAKEDGTATSESRNVLAVIGPEFREEAEVVTQILSALPSDERVAQVGFSFAKSDPNDFSSESNLFRLIPDNSHQIKVMISLMTKLGWNYVAIIYEESTYGSDGAMELKRLAHVEAICIPLFKPLPVVNNGAVKVTELQSIIRNVTLLGIRGLVFLGSSNKANILLTTIEGISGEIAEIPSLIFSEGVSSSNHAFYDGKNVIGVGKGSFVVCPTKREMSDFVSHWKLLFQNTTFLIEEASTNPLLLNIFEQVTSCRPSDNQSCPALNVAQFEKLSKMSLYTSYAIEAAFITAKSISLTMRKSCGLEANCRPGEILQTMESVSVNFREDFGTDDFGDLVAQFETKSIVIQMNIPIYDVYNFQDDTTTGFNFIKVGEWKNNILTMDLELIRGYSPGGQELQWPSIEKAQCPRGRVCRECIIASQDVPYTMYYEPGDVIIVGFFPLFDSGDGPFGCGNIRTDFGLQVAEGIVFLAGKANKKEEIFKEIFPNMHIGFVIINSCNNALVAQEAFITLFNKGVRLWDGSYVDVKDKVIGIIGEQGSTVSMETYNVIGKLNRLQVSYGATNPLLSNRDDFPFIMRVTTPDNKQGAVMIDIAKQLNFTYIQIVHSDDKYGEGGRDAVLEAAKNNKVCVAQVISVKQFKDYGKLVNELRKQWHAKFVIIFLRSHVTGDVMETINNNMDGVEFTFIGSEAWGSNKKNLRENTNLVGSLTVALEMGQPSDFNTFLTELEPDSQPYNPWLQTYMQNKMNCFYPLSFNKSADRECTENDKLTNFHNYEQDIWTPFGMNAISALLLAADKTFKELCGEIQHICPNFHNPPTLIKHMKTIELDTQQIGQYNRVFDSNGDGLVAYTIYNIQLDAQDTTNLIYKKVGEAPIGQPAYLRHDELKVPKLVSVCPNPQVCSECFPESEAPKDDQIEDVHRLPLGISLGVALMTILILLIVGYCYMRRLKEELRYARDYITPKSMDNLAKDLDEVPSTCNPEGRYASPNQHMGSVL